MEKTSSEEAVFTCYEVCHPSQSMTASHQRFRLERGESASITADLWLSDDPGFSIVKCEVAKHVKARLAAELPKAIRETGRLPRGEPIVVPVAALEIQDAETGARLVAVDQSRIEMSHVGTLVELLFKQPAAELKWLVGRNLILRPLHG